MGMKDTGAGAFAMKNPHEHFGDLYIIQEYNIVRRFRSCYFRVILEKKTLTQFFKNDQLHFHQFVVQN